MELDADVAVVGSGAMGRALFEQLDRTTLLD